MSHPNRSSQPKAEVTKLVAKLMKADEKNTVVFGFSTAFGGGRSTGFGLVYDSQEMLKKIEPKHRLIRLGLATKKTRTRKQWKDAKRKSKRTWGASGERGARRGAAPPPAAPLNHHTRTRTPRTTLAPQVLAGGRQLAPPRRPPPAKQSCGALTSSYCVFLALIFQRGCAARSGSASAARLILSPPRGSGCVIVSKAHSPHLHAPPPPSLALTRSTA